MARHTVKNHWFVSVVTFARRTKSFPTETEAKQFANAMLSETEKHHIVAGTLLGASLPVRRIISGSQLYSWVKES